MYWRQKASILGTNQNRTNQIQTLIENELAGKDTRYVDVEQSTTQGKRAPTLIVVVEYNVQADADAVWADVQSANASGWIDSPSFATYAAFNDDGTFNQSLGRIDW
jgi:hypothetical protein